MPATTPITHGTRWGAVVAVSLGIVLVALDMTIVAVILPELGSTFGASPAQTQWVVLAYMLPLVALSIPAGRWLDTVGPLPAFLIAVSGFGITSALIALAPTLSLVLAGRAAQGLFGALISVIGMPIVASAVRPEHRARAMSIVLTLIPLAGVAGPALGGVLADAFGWRTVFLVNVPIVLVTMAIGRVAIPSRTATASGLAWPTAGMLREAATLGVAAAALLLAVDSFTDVSPGRLALAALLAVIAAGAVAGWLRMPTSRAVVDLLRRRPLALPMLALPMSTAAVGGLNFLVPYLLAGGSASPRTIGLTLLALSAGMAALSPVAGVIADRIGNRPVTVAGAGVVLAGVATLLVMGPDAGPADLAWRLAVVGVGNGLFAGPNSAAILAATPARLTGTASGVASLLRTLGFSLGPALGAVAWTVSGGGPAGFASGVAVLGIGAGVALAATLAGRSAALQR